MARCRQRPHSAWALCKRRLKAGVKYVHQAVHEYYDVGVYFESNGHGAVLFGDAYDSFLLQAETFLRTTSNNDNKTAVLALQRLRLLLALVNQAVG